MKRVCLTLHLSKKPFQLFSQSFKRLRTLSVLQTHFFCSSLQGLSSDNTYVKEEDFFDKVFFDIFHKMLLDLVKVERNSTTTDTEIYKCSVTI